MFATRIGCVADRPWKDGFLSPSLEIKPAVLRTPTAQLKLQRSVSRQTLKKAAMMCLPARSVPRHEPATLEVPPSRNP
jgi:hypothetical protein